MNTLTWNKSYGKQGEQLLKSGGHSASLDETIKYRGNADSRIIIRWSQSHATSNINKYKSKQYEPQQKNRLGTVGNKLPGA